MKNLYILICLIGIMTGCSENVIEIDQQTHVEIPTESIIEYEDGVMMLADLGVKDVIEISDEEVELDISRNIDANSLVGKIVVFQQENTSRHYFVGRVTGIGNKPISRTREGKQSIVLCTEPPTMNEVYKELVLNPKMDYTNVTLGDIEYDEDSNVEVGAPVDDSVWDGLEVLNSSNTEFDDITTNSRASSYESGLYPINVTIPLKIKSNDGSVSGTVYYKIYGQAQITKSNSVLRLNHKIGIKGELKKKNKG